MDHPRQWDLVQRGFELASQRLRESGVKNELVGPLDQIRWDTPVRDAVRKITERRWKRDAMVSAEHELVEIREALTKVIDDIEPVMQHARNVIAKFSPTIPQMAQQTADQLREMEETKTEVADTLENEDAAQQPETSEAARQQEEVTQDVSKASEDVARAARHERRLNNAAVAEPLQNAANNIQQVAQNESANAQAQLNEATVEAEQGEANGIARALRPISKCLQNGRRKSSSLGRASFMVATWCDEGRLIL